MITKEQEKELILTFKALALGSDKSKEQQKRELHLLCAGAHALAMITKDPLPQFWIINIMSGRCDRIIEEVSK
jgi:hypothetical protein